MRLIRVELLSHVRPPWTKDFVAELAPPAGFTVHYDDGLVVILKGDQQVGILDGSMVRYADVWITPPVVPEPEPTAPSLAYSVMPKRRGRPPKNK